MKTIRVDMATVTVEPGETAGITKLSIESPSQGRVELYLSEPERQEIAEALRSSGGPA